MGLSNITVPDSLAYMAAFLTFRCRFGCSYCINHFKDLSRRDEMSASDWVNGLNRLELSKDIMVPITLQGGEPSMHKGFYDIIRNLKKEFYIDLLTNLDFDIHEFMKNIPPVRLQRDVPYASIRVSYHPEKSELSNLLDKIEAMQKAGYSVGLFAVEHPETEIDTVRNMSEKKGIDFRTKEFLGMYQDKLYGQYKYEDACNNDKISTVTCKTHEILIAPDGTIHKCHRDLYHGQFPVAHILDKDLNIEFMFRQCSKYGECNPCDIKVKNNRFQQFGHCSVEIKP